MSQQKGSIIEETRFRVSPPHRYEVIFHNDDFTPMEFVTDVLEKVFHMEPGEAAMKMLEVHRAARQQSEPIATTWPGVWPTRPWRWPAMKAIRSKSQSSPKRPPAPWTTIFFLFRPCFT